MDDLSGKSKQRLIEEITRLRSALQKIERWDLPSTGRKHEDGEPMSFAYCYGLNGEREYIRRIAREALS